MSEQSKFEDLSEELQLTNLRAAAASIEFCKKHAHDYIPNSHNNLILMEATNREIARSGGSWTVEMLEAVYVEVRDQFNDDESELTAHTKPEHVPAYPWGDSLTRQAIKDADVATFRGWKNGEHAQQFAEQLAALGAER